VSIHLPGEHAAKLELPEIARHALHLGGHVAERAVVLLVPRQSVQLRRLAQTFADSVERGDDAFERSALPAETLRARGIRPYVRILELTVDFFEAVTLFLIVKGTP
jgi:hypothetical protein